MKVNEIYEYEKNNELKKLVEIKLSNDNLIEISNIIKNDVDKDLIDSIFVVKSFLYRGIKYPPQKNYFISEPRENRKPVDTPVVFDKIINDIMDKNGIQARRNNSFFITKKHGTAENYGHVHLVFPLNDFYYYSNKNIADLYLILKDRFSDFIKEKRIDEFPKEIIEYVFNKNGEDLKKIFYDRIFNPLKRYFNIVIISSVDREDIKDDVQRKIFNIYKESKNLDRTVFDILNELLFEIENKKYEEMSLSFIKDILNLFKKYSLKKISKNIIFTNNYISDLIKNASAMIPEDMMFSILKSMKEMGTNEYDSNLEKIYIDFFKNNNFIKKIEDIILNDAMYGKFSENKKEFIDLINSHYGNEILIRGKCLFLNSNILIEEKLFDKLKNLVYSNKQEQI
mgnify:CR=1 FL=1